MFGWLTGKEKQAHASLPEIGSQSDVEALFQRDVVVVFKHSHACPVSWAAHTQVTRYAAAHPSVPVLLLNVIKERPLSRELAQRLQVEHESPQVIVLRHGVVDAVASHGGITAGELNRMLQPS